MLSDRINKLVGQVKLLTAGNDPEKLAGALRQLAELYRFAGREDKAIESYDEAISLLRSAGNTLDLAHAIRHLGNIHRRAGRFDEARACYDEALPMCRASDEISDLDLANTIRVVALLDGVTGNRLAAERLWTEARELYERTGIREGVEECEANLAALSEN